MIGFRTARALVVDDKPDEAVPVIKALGKLGVSSVFSDAARRTDAEKYDGIRLLCLDMILSETRGTPPNDPNAAADSLVQALSETVAFSADPVVVVCFTRKPDYVNAFKARFEAVFPHTPLLLVDPIEKGQMEDDEEVKNLVQRVRTAVGSQAPLSLFLGWEQMVHDSATATTASLNALIAQFASRTSTGWSQCGFVACAALALAERGRRLAEEDDKDSLSALYAILTPLLADRLEHRTPQKAAPELAMAAKNLQASVKAEVSRWDNKEPEPAHPPLPDAFSQAPIADCGEVVVAAEVPPEPPLLPKELRASLNSALQLSFQVAASELTPGNVYLCKEPSNSQLSGPVIGNMDAAKQDTFVLSGTSGSELKPLFLEITPSCDFSQAKAKLPRFVLGFSFPSSLRDQYRDAQFTRLIDGPLFLTRDHGMKPEDVRFIALNAHYVFALSQKTAQKLKPAFRLRSPVLTDIVAWVGAHTARPGYASVGP